jgi:type I restriction enzyme M protein
VIKDNGYNLDIKNPHTVDFEHRNVEDMLEEYAILLADLGDTRNSLKQELITALGREGV